MHTLYGDYMKSFGINSCYFLTLLAAFSFTCTSSLAISYIGAENGMCFHKVITDSNKKSIPGYELAGRLFPDADLYSWASNTLIKKKIGGQEIGYQVYV